MNGKNKLVNELRNWHKNEYSTMLEDACSERKKTRAQNYEN